MTLLGKILVFFVLALSVVNGALVTMIYATRTHWVDEFTKLQGRYQIAVASERTYKAEVEKARQEADAHVEEAEGRRKLVQAKLAAQEKEMEDLRNGLRDQS